MEQTSGVAELDILSWLDREESVKPKIAVRSSAHAKSLTTDNTVKMSFEVQREILLNLLNKAIPAVPTNTMIPVLNNLKCTVNQDTLVITGSSKSMSVAATTDQVATSVAGTRVFPARTLLNIIKECAPGSTVFVEVTDSGAVIAAGSFSVEIALAEARGFPELEDVAELEFHSVNRVQFIDAINIVKYALPSREFSGQSSMKMINIKGGKFTACDGSRFQQSRIDGFKLHMQLPSDSISVLTKLLGGSDLEFLEIGEVAKKLIFKLGNTVFYVNKLDDPYPNVEQLWLRPALSNDQELLVNRQELITAIKQVRTTADTNSSALGLQVEAESMRIVTKDTNNSASATIACKWSGKPRNIVVNYLHLAEMLKAYPSEECRFMLGEDTQKHKSPILLRDDDTMAIATISQLLAYQPGLL